MENHRQKRERRKPPDEVAGVFGRGDSLKPARCLFSGSSKRKRARERCRWGKTEKGKPSPQTKAVFLREGRQLEAGTMPFFWVKQKEKSAGAVPVGKIKRQDFESQHIVVLPKRLDSGEKIVVIKSIEGQSEKKP